MSRISLHWWESLFEALDAKDTQVFLDFLADDATFRLGNAPALRGRQAIGRALGAFLGSVGASKHHILRTWHDSHTRVCQGEVAYTRSDGSEVTLPFASVLVMAGEKVGQYLFYAELSALRGPAG